MERFFRSLKTEWVPTAGYRTFAEAHKRSSDTLLDITASSGYISITVGTPNESERLYWENSKTVANFS